ncbi:MAG: hypothetical protein AAFV54_05550 [Pseudomonadota bacterium]
MMVARKKSGYVTGWLPAIVFNVLLFLIPLFSVQVIAGTFSDSVDQATPTAETITETRKTIDRTFEALAPAGDGARASWAELVDRQLDARNTSAARGFLLAAPQLLSREDARAIRAAASDELSGSADQRLLRAALLFLPNDVRNGYLESARPKGTELISAEDVEDGSSDPEEVDVSDTEATIISFPGSDETSFVDPIDHMTRPADFYVLGTLEDLANNSRDWLRGNRRNTIELKLTGLAMTGDPDLINVSPARLNQAASVLKTTIKSGRLGENYARSLRQRIDIVIPDDTLQLELERALSEVAPLDVRAERVREAFAASIDYRAAARLAPEFNQIGRITEVTGPMGALSLLEHAHSARDIRRARLVAEAGGDRTVALTTLIGGRTLSLTGMNLQWSERTILLVMALAAACIALLLTVISALLRMAFGRPVTAIF